MSDKNYDDVLNKIPLSIIEEHIQRRKEEVADLINNCGWETF